MLLNNFVYLFDDNHYKGYNIFYIIVKLKYTPNKDYTRKLN